MTAIVGDSHGQGYIFVNGYGGADGYFAGAATRQRVTNETNFNGNWSTVSVPDAVVLFGLGLAGLTMIRCARKA